MPRFFGPAGEGGCLRRVALALAFALTVGLAFPLSADAYHTGFFHAGAPSGRIKVFTGGGHHHHFMTYDPSIFKPHNPWFVPPPHLRHGALPHRSFGHDKFLHRRFLPHRQVIILVPVPLRNPCD